MDVVDALTAALPDAVSTAAEQREAHRRDTWVRRIEQERNGDRLEPPLAVVTPASASDVATALRICNEHGTPVLPFGGGSGVVGGVASRADGVVISTAALSGLRELNRDDLLATFGAAFTTSLVAIAQRAHRAEFAVVEETHALMDGDTRW